MAEDNKIKTIIAEDESWICRLIKKIINWEELGFEICGEASNGVDALEMTKAIRPDVIITDIRMPGMDGIALIRNVKEYNPETITIIVSGHNDFTYAKEAIKYGAFAYLLKPIKRNEFLELIIRVKEKILKNREKALQDSHLKNELVQQRSELKENYFSNLLFLDIQNKLSLNEINEKFGANFNEGCFQSLIYVIDKKNTDYTEDKDYETETLDYIKQITQTHFYMHCNDMVVIKHINRLILLLNYNPSDKSLIMNLVKTSFIKVNDIIRKYYLTIGLGEIVEDFSLLNESYIKAADAVKARVIYDVNNIIDISGKQFEDINMNGILSSKKEIKLTNYFETNDFSSAAEYISNLLKELSGKNIHPNLIFEVAYEIVELLFTSMRKKNPEFENQYITKKQIYDQFDYFYSIENIKEYFIDLLSGIQMYFENLRRGQDRKIISVLKEYIHEHFKEEINLSDYANVVFLSPKYLSELFKKETGLSITEYVINYRMKIAKELLNDMKYNINEVAEMVGYIDSKHFSKLFKKIVGVNPSEYKKVLQ